MKRWTMVMACALVVGLMSAPISVYADNHGDGGQEETSEGGDGGEGACGGDGGDEAQHEGSH